MTREEALLKIGELVAYARNQGWDDSYTDAFKTLEQEPRWIPVSERLPEMAEFYLTSIKWDDGTERVIISWFDGMSFKAEVIAWMPLPEPYKAESEDKK